MPDAGWKEKAKALEAQDLSRYGANMIHLNKRVLALIAAVLCLNSIALASSERLFERKDISKIPSEPPQAMSRGEFKHSGMTGTYFLFSPPTVLSAAAARPLVVFLHGCTQDAEEFATLTKMNELAIRENFYVLYPQQSAERNAQKCWNWFSPINQGEVQAQEALEESQRGSELGWIAGLTESVANELSVDSDRIYVAGLSAGAAMTVNLLSCYPDLYAAGGVFAGVPFAAADNVLEAMSVMRIGSLHSSRATAEKAFACAQSKTGAPVSLMVFHGKMDLVISHRNAKQIVSHFGAYNDLRDDGAANESDALKLVSRKTTRAKRKANSYVTEAYKSEAGAKINFVSVKRLGHAWSGGNPDSRYSEAKTPAGTDLLWNFFSSIEPKELVGTHVSNTNSDSDKR